MTIGIYALYWAEQDLIYVGKSQAIEHRWNDHKASAKRGVHTNYSVQKAYDLYGEPEYIILEAVGLDSLSIQEQVWTQELNALNKDNGLCIVPPNGFKPNTSVYSSIQILKVFSLLYKKILSIGEISCRTKVNRATVKKIAIGKLHIWLKESYPNKYALLSERTSTPKSNVAGSIIKHKDGSVYTIISISAFCKEHPLLSSSWNYNKSRISLVLKGILKEFKGFYITGLEC